MAYMRPIESYKVSQEKINEVQKAINERGFWEAREEWRISTVTNFRIEPQVNENVLYYMTTVKCEQETKIPARTINRALLFMELYRDFQRHLWHEIGWASWAEKNKREPND